MDNITCGGFVWERNPAASDNRLDGGSLCLANSIAGGELSIDTMEIEIYSECRIPDLFAPADHDALETADGRLFYVRSGAADIMDIPYGAPVEYYRDGVLAARLYKSEIARTGPSVYQLTAVSAIGLLDKLPHKGGLYTGQTVGEILADIIGGYAAYTISPEVSGINVFGWLPASTRRDNLRQLLFATGAAVRKDADGKIRFAFLSADSPVEIEAERVYSGGSVASEAPATGVDVTEHAYYATDADAEAVLFDNTDGSGTADRQTVTFDGPHHGLTASGLTLHERGVNYAVVSGIGVLRGLKYTHQTKTISLKSPDAAGDERIVSVKDCTLISAVNSRTVAERVLAYYSGARTVSAGIVVGTERPGDAITMEDVFGDDTTGLLESMDIRISNTLKADAKIITGYIPAGQGNTYNHYAVLTGSGAWAVPVGVTRIKVSLVGGGDGGSGGTGGTDGTAGTPGRYDPLDAWITGGGTAGDGGAAGSKGLGGKLFSSEIGVAPGQSIQFVCGAGGSAGPTGGVPETVGTDTIFGDLSSASGARNPYGLSNLYTGIVYGANGLDGYDGGDGAVGVSADTYPPPSGEPEDVQCYPGLPGQDCADGTAGGPGGPALYRPVGGYIVSACGGSGGGAAFGAPGVAGGSPSYTHDDGSSNWDTWYKAIGGRGGNGASPLPGADGANYGCGGSAGHGGGGGGCPGGAYCGKIVGESYNAANAGQGAPGVGGSGSPGGKGGDGCVLIYY